MLIKSVKVKSIKKHQKYDKNEFIEHAPFLLWFTLNSCILKQAGVIHARRAATPHFFARAQQMELDCMQSFTFLCWQYILGFISANVTT